MGVLRLIDDCRFGERAIDLDIILYDDLILDTPDLTIPHPRMTEREFVLRPLCEYAYILAPHIHPFNSISLHEPSAQCGAYCSASDP